MIEKINFGEKYSIQGGFDVVADKIDEIIDEVNRISSSAHSIECATVLNANTVSDSKIECVKNDTLL